MERGSRGCDQGGQAQEPQEQHHREERHEAPTLGGAGLSGTGGNEPPGDYRGRVAATGRALQARPDARREDLGRDLHQEAKGGAHPDPNRASPRGHTPIRHPMEADEAGGSNQVVEGRGDGGDEPDRFEDLRGGRTP